MEPSRNRTTTLRDFLGKLNPDAWFSSASDSYFKKSRSPFLSKDSDDLVSFPVFSPLEYANLLNVQFLGQNSSSVFLVCYIEFSYTTSLVHIYRAKLVSPHTYISNTTASGFSLHKAPIM